MWEVDYCHDEPSFLFFEGVLKGRGSQNTGDSKVMNGYTAVILGRSETEILELSEYCHTQNWQPDHPHWLS